MVKDSTLRARASNPALKATPAPERGPAAPRRPFYDSTATASPFATLTLAGRPSIFASPSSRPISTTSASDPVLPLFPTPPQLASHNATAAPPKRQVSESSVDLSRRSISNPAYATNSSSTRFPLSLDPSSTTSPLKPTFGVPAFENIITPPKKLDTAKTATSKAKDRIEKVELSMASDSDTSDILTPAEIDFSDFDNTFNALLRQRLADVKRQLETSGLSQSMHWYLEAEVRRLEGKLGEDSFKLLDEQQREANLRIVEMTRWITEQADKLPKLAAPRSVAEITAALKELERARELREKQREVKPEDFTLPFCKFLTDCPTVFHAVSYFGNRLAEDGFKKLSERSLWTEVLEKDGKYYVERNGSSLIAFTIGKDYRPGNGVAMIAGHVDAITARLKPISSKRTTAGYVQLGVAPYAGGLNATWWDRDLSIGGKVLVKDSKTSKISTQLVKLGWPIARVPTLAPHFGVGMMGQQNLETQAVPIIGLDNSDIHGVTEDFKATTLGGARTFASTQPPRLVRAIAGELKIQDLSTIINWELELFDLQPATVGGIDKDLIFGGRIDDKLCSYAAVEGLLASSPQTSSVINMVALFDDEEIGSLLRQGARGNFMPSVIERIVDAFSSDNKNGSASIMAQTYARSFLISADVTHAVNPNFLSSYLEGHSPRLNVGPAVQADGNGHTTTDAVSTAFLTRIAEKCGSELQVFMIRNDSRSGGTVGPTLSSSMGVRAIDCGIPQLSMHSIRATTGSLDPGLGVKLYKGFFDYFEAVDEEFAD